MSTIPWDISTLAFFHVPYDTLFFLKSKFLSFEHLGLRYICMAVERDW